jgi:hypothetical protein
MNDEKLEQLLRDLPAPEFPTDWRTEILSNAMWAARVSPSRREVGSPVLHYLLELCRRNPITASAMTALWLLIFLFQVTTPMDPQEKILLAHIDSNRSVYLVSVSEQIRLVQLALDESNQTDRRLIP